MSSDIELNTNIVDGTDGADTMKWGEQSPTAVDLEQAHLLDVNAPSSSSNDRDGVTKVLFVDSKFVLSRLILDNRRFSHSLGVG